MVVTVTARLEGKSESESEFESLFTVRRHFTPPIQAVVATGVRAFAVDTARAMQIAAEGSFKIEVQSTSSLKLLTGAFYTHTELLENLFRIAAQDSASGIVNTDFYNVTYQHASNEPALLTSRHEFDAEAGVQRPVFLVANAAGAGVYPNLFGLDWNGGQ